MINSKDALDRARGETQELLKKIEASTGKNHAALRTELESAAAKARELSASLQAIAQGQRADAKQHLDDAVSGLEDAARQAKQIAAATDADLKKTGRAMLDRARNAVQSLSRAVASKRAAAAGGAK